MQKPNEAAAFPRPDYVGPQRDQYGWATRCFRCGGSVIRLEERVSGICDGCAQELPL